MSDIRIAQRSINACFPRAIAYAGLFAPGGVAREAPPANLSKPPSERHLQCAWYDRAWGDIELFTREGEQVTVLEPGRWNLEAGPDFLDAVLLVGPERRTLRGDVEVHMRPRNWRDHGHAGDPRYARVVAHVTYHADFLVGEELPAGAIQVSLETPLQRTAGFAFESIDVTAYPFAALPTRTPRCARVLKGWSAAEREALLHSAGEARLKGKAALFVRRAEQSGIEQQLYEDVLGALGYKHNQAPFRQLARRITLDTFRDESAGDPVRAYALLLGVAGMLPRKPSSHWDDEARQFGRKLWDLWWRMESRWGRCTLPPDAWRMAGVRPTNHPARRLAAAAVLFSEWPGRMGALFEADATDSKAWLKRAYATFSEDLRMDFWDYHLGFGGKRRASRTALLGKARVSAILTNVVVPFMAARGRDIADLLPCIPREQDNAIMRQTAHALFGRDHDPSLYANGLRQQGLLQIFRDFCLTNRRGCEACDLVDALESQNRG